MADTDVSIGIDPGKSGAIAILLDGKISLLTAFETAGLTDVAKAIVGEHRDSFEGHTACCVEKVGAMPGQGVTSMFSFGKTAGYIEGVLDAMGIPYQLVPPQRWKKEFGLNSDKEKSIEVAKRLFPGVNLRRTDRCKKDHDGMAEALLMAEYARRKL